MNSYEEFITACEKKQYSFMKANFNVVSFHNDKQFADILKETNLSKDEFIDRYTASGHGTYVRKECLDTLNSLIDEAQTLFDEKLNQDPDGSHFIKEMFTTEIKKSDFKVTHNLYSVLDSLNYLGDELDSIVKRINSDPKLKNGLEIALNEQRYHEIFHETLHNNMLNHFYESLYSLTEHERKTFFFDLNMVKPREYYQHLYMSLNSLDSLRSSFDKSSEKVSIFMDVMENLERCAELLSVTKLGSVIENDLTDLNECVIKGSIDKSTLKNELKDFNNPDLLNYVLGKKKLFDNQEINSDYNGLKM